MNAKKAQTSGKAEGIVYLCGMEDDLEVSFVRDVIAGHLVKVRWSLLGKESGRQGVS
jgi:hypothetical protein